MLLALAYGAPAAGLGMLVFAVVGLALAVPVGALALAGGDPLVAVGIVAGLLVLVIFPNRFIIAALGSDAFEVPDDEEWRPTRRGMLAAGVVVAPVLGVAMAVSRDAWVGLVVALVGCSVVSSVLSTRGRLDAEAYRLRKNGREASLTELTRTRRLDLGAVSLYWLSYARGSAGIWTPRLLLVPRAKTDEVESAFAAGVAADPDADPIGRAQRVVALTFGLGMALTGPVLWWVAPVTGRGHAVFAYGSVLGLVFAAPMLWYAMTA